MTDIEETVMMCKCEGVNDFFKDLPVSGLMKAMEGAAAFGFNYLPPPPRPSPYISAMLLPQSKVYPPIVIEPDAEASYEKPLTTAEFPMPENSCIPEQTIKCEEESANSSETVIKLEIDISKSIIIGSHTNGGASHSSVCEVCGVLLPENQRTDDKRLDLPETQCQVEEMPSNARKILVKCVDCVQKLEKPYVMTPDATKALKQPPTRKQNVETLDITKEIYESPKIMQNNHTEPNKLKYQCNRCDRSFIRNGQLNRHLRTHTGENPYKCSVCGTRFVWKSRLVAHMKIHTREFLPADPSTLVKLRGVVCPREKLYAYPGWNNAFPLSNELLYHERTHTGESSPNYGVHGQVSRLGEFFSRNVLLDSPERKLKCVICCMGFRDISELTKHVSTHAGKVQHKCFLCEKICASSNELRTHQCRPIRRVVHKCYTTDPNGSNPGSPFIKHNTTSKEKLTQDRVHRKPYICTVCNKGFKQKGHLNDHTRIHTGEKPYKCNFCGKEFRTQGALTVHRRVHSADKP